MNHTSTPRRASADPSRSSFRAVVGRLRGTNNEGILALTLALLVLVIGLVNPAFWSLATVFSVVRSSMVIVVFALGVLMVIITRQIDVSFPIVGIFAAYSTIKVFEAVGEDLGPILGFVIAAAIGIGLGLVNGFIIATFQLPALIVSLGTVGIFRGVLLVFVGSTYIGTLPSSLNTLSMTSLVTASHGAGVIRLHVFVIPVILLCLLTSFFLNRTMWGRGLYAIGGDIESARRAGFAVARIQVGLYAMVGMLAGIAGMMYITLARTANPHDMTGAELDVIAAVVLGGASILGGRGSVLGTVLGVVLISVIQNSLLLMGVPSTWQRAAVGILLLLGITAQLLGRNRGRAKQVLEQEPLAPMTEAGR